MQAYEDWSKMPVAGVGVRHFQEFPKGNRFMYVNSSLSNSEWTTALKLSVGYGNVRGDGYRCGRQDEFGQPGRPSNFCVEYRTQLRCPLLRQASLRARARARASDADADLKKFVAAVWSLRLIAISCGTERVCCVVHDNSLQSELHPISHC